MVGHSLELYGHSQDRDVILCHLKSVPGESQASHRGDRLTSEKAIDFLGRRKCGVVGQSVFCRGSCV